MRALGSYALDRGVAERVHAVPAVDADRGPRQQRRLVVAEDLARRVVFRGVLVRRDRIGGVFGDGQGRAFDVVVDRAGLAPRRGDGQLQGAQASLETLANVDVQAERAAVDLRCADVHQLDEVAADAELLGLLPDRLGLCGLGLPRLLENVAEGEAVHGVVAHRGVLSGCGEIGGASSSIIARDRRRHLPQLYPSGHYSGRVSRQDPGAPASTPSPLGGCAAPAVDEIAIGGLDRDLVAPGGACI
nr:hypothetical protein [Corynebacterium xerosis]